MSNFSVSLNSLKTLGSQAKALLPADEKVFSNNGFAILSGAAVNFVTHASSDLITSFALPAVIGTFVEPTATALTDRLTAFASKKYVDYRKKELPLQTYKDSSVYKGTAYVMKTALPILVTHTAINLLGHNMTMLQVGLNGFFIPAATHFCYETLKNEIAKRETATKAQEAKPEPATAAKKAAANPTAAKTSVKPPVKKVPVKPTTPVNAQGKTVAASPTKASASIAPQVAIEKNQPEATIPTKAPSTVKV